MEITQEQKLYSQVVEKAWQDANFKQRLIDDPLNTIEELTGQRIRMPEGKKLVVSDQSTGNTVYVNIPPLDSDMELNEKELEKVAGGCQVDSFGGLKPWGQPTFY